MVLLLQDQTLLFCLIYPDSLAHALYSQKHSLKNKLCSSVDLNKLEFISTLLINQVGDMMLELFLNTAQHCHSNFKSWAKMSYTEPVQRKRGAVSTESRTQKFNNIKIQLKYFILWLETSPHHEQAY